MGNEGEHHLVSICAESSTIGDAWQFDTYDTREYSYNPQVCLILTHSLSASRSPVLVPVVVMGSMEIKTSRSLMLIL